MTNDNLMRINESTTMIDIELFGVKRVGAVYLIQSGRTCLIDSGTKKEAKTIIRTLDSQGAFPPDIIILSHSHWDHSQGVPALRREAEKRGRKIAVMASEKAIDNLQDQSWNRVFDEKQVFEGIEDVEPLKDGQVVNLQGLELEVIDIAGHCADDIALFDRHNKMIFVEADQKGKLEDAAYIKDNLIKELNITLPELEVSKAFMRFMLGAINTFRKLIGKNQIRVAEVQMEGIVGWLAKRYKTYTQREQ